VPDFGRRSIILGTAGVAAAGAGVTAAASGLSGSVEGQADVQAEQALTVTEVTINSTVDASFKRISDDNTEFQVAVELNNGDDVVFLPEVSNNAADSLDVQITIDSPDVIDIAVGIEYPTSGGSSVGDNDANVDDANAQDGAIKTGEGAYVATLPGSSSDSSEGDNTIAIVAELDDTADTSSYDIGAAINPLSTDN
jgi:hypothetical protein